MKIFKIVCSITDKFDNFELINVYSYACDISNALIKAEKYMEKLVARRNNKERLGKTFKILCFEQVSLAKNKKYSCR